MSYDLPLTLAIVKAELGIDNTDSDALITARLPYAEAKFRAVAGYDFNYVFSPVYDTASDTIKVYQGPDSQINLMNYGDIILSPNHPDGTYITQNYKIPTDDGTGLYYEIKVSENSTAASDNTATVLCYNTSHYAVLSQLVWFMIGEQSIDSADDPSVQSERHGPNSVTYGKGEMNQTFGLPNKIVKAIPNYASIG